VDNDVAVFGRILRSEARWMTGVGSGGKGPRTLPPPHRRSQVDEEYVQVTRQLRDTATELLRVQLKQARGRE